MPVRALDHSCNSTHRTVRSSFNDLKRCAMSEKTLVQYAFETNFYVCVFWTFANIYWLVHALPNKVSGDDRFVYRAYVLWWGSWVIWTMLWLLIAFKKQEDIAKAFASMPFSFEITTLGLSDLHAIVYILVYLFLVRGRELRVGHASVIGIVIALSFISVFALSYVGFGDGDIKFAVELHEKWSLAVGVLVPVLLGWGCRLRFRSRVPLVAGFIYSAVQPAAYAVVFPDHPPDHPSMGVEVASAVVIFTLALLKTAFSFTMLSYLTRVPPSNVAVVIENPATAFKWTAEGVGVIALGLVSVILVGVSIIWIVPTEALPKMTMTWAAIVGIFTIISGSIAVVNWLEKRGQSLATANVQKPKSTGVIGQSPQSEPGDELDTTG